MSARSRLRILYYNVATARHGLCMVQRSNRRDLGYRSSSCRRLWPTLTPLARARAAGYLSLRVRAYYA